MFVVHSRFISHLREDYGISWLATMTNGDKAKLLVWLDTSRFDRFEERTLTTGCAYAGIFVSNFWFAVAGNSQMFFSVLEAAITPGGSRTANFFFRSLFQKRSYINREIAFWHPERLQWELYAIKVLSNEAWKSMQYIHNRPKPGPFALASRVISNIKCGGIKFQMVIPSELSSPSTRIGS